MFNQKISIAMFCIMIAIITCYTDTSTGFAQTTQQPPAAAKEYTKSRIEAYVAEWSRAKEWTKLYLEAMPEEGYNFRPTPEVWTYAQQMLHLAGGNYYLVTKGLGVVNPFEGTNFFEGKNVEAMAEFKKDKASVTKSVMDCYDFIIKTLKSTPEAKLHERIKFAGMLRPRTAIIDSAFEHQTHHRGQTAVYLRLKGVKPPEEILFSH